MSTKDTARAARTALGPARARTRRSNTRSGPNTANIGATGGTPHSGSTVDDGTIERDAIDEDCIDAINDRLLPAGSDRSPAARRLLEAADELFFRRGASATSIRDITGACGLTPGALYNHFPSKDDLLFALVEERHHFVENAVSRALDGAGPEPVARLAAMVRVYIRLHVRCHKASRIANREYRNLSEEHRAAVVASRRRLRDTLVSILVDGLHAGVFEIIGGTDRASVTIAAAAILDMCVYASEWLHDGGPLSVDDIEERYVTMALRLVGATVPHPLPGGLLKGSLSGSERHRVGSSVADASPTLKPVGRPTQALTPS